MTRSGGAAARAGFTIIEMLVVIFIISVLAGLVLAGVSSARESAKVNLAKATIHQLEQALENYRTDFGDYPPSSLAHMGLRVPNNTNVGIEALVACLAAKGSAVRSSYYDWKEDQLGNLDRDALSVNPLRWQFGDNQLRELLDPWGNPYVYVHNRDYADPADVARYKDGQGNAFTIRPGRSAATATYHKVTSFQIWSLGSDGVNQNGEGDDVVNWSLR